MENENKNFYSDIIKTITTALPILILGYLACNFIFNAGYFYPLGIRYMSLLNMQDYYEGTAPFLAFIYCFFSGFFNVSIHSIENIKYLPKSFLDFINCHLYLPCRILHIKSIKMVRIFIAFCKKNKISYSEKRIYAIVRKDLRDIEEKLKNKFAPLSRYDFFNIVICFLFIFYPLYYFYTKIYLTDKTMFYYVFILWLVYAFLLTKLKLLYRILLSIIVLILFLFFLGIFIFECNYKNSTIMVQLKNNNEYKLVRVISRGAIVKDNDYMVKFIQWNEINQLSKNIENMFKSAK